MDKDFYKDLEKIKTIGSTYMAAVGLAPTAGTRVSSSQATCSDWLSCRCFWDPGQVPILGLVSLC